MSYTTGNFSGSFGTGVPITTSWEQSTIHNDRLKDATFWIGDMSTGWANR